MTKKTILISGVSSGIGLEIAGQLAQKGHNVIGISRRPPGDTFVEWNKCDVRDSEAVKNSVDRLLGKYKALDCVICNAGIGHFGSIEETSEETARTLFDTNYFGVINIIKASLGFFRSQKKGRIIIIGSLAGKAPLPFQAHYSASKAAIESLSFSLHMEVAPFGISVSLIESGDIQTSFNENMLWEMPEESPYESSLRNSSAIVHRNMSSAPKADLVANLVMSIVSSDTPKLRYSIGPFSKIVPLAKRIFPDNLNVMLIRKNYGLKK